MEFDLTWAVKALKQRKELITPDNLARITGWQINRWQAEAWLKQQARGVSANGQIDERSNDEDNKR
jgi:hypothetical protein